MITVSADGNAISDGFAAAVAQPIVSYDAVLLADGSRVPGDLKSVSLSIGCDDAGDTVIGTASSAQAAIAIAGCSESMAGREIELQIGVEVDGAYEYVSVARLLVTEARTVAGVTTVQACGRIAAMAGTPLGLSAGYYAPSTLAAAIASSSDVTVNLGAFASTTAPAYVSDGMSCRDALAALALSLGGYAAETGGGSVMVGPVPTSAAVTVTESQKRPLPSLSDADYHLDGVEVSVPDPESGQATLYTHGSGRLQITDEHFTEEMAAQVWANVQGRSFTPGTVSTAVFDPRLTPFDAVAVDVEGVTRTVPAFGITVTYDGGYFGSVSASGPSQAQEAASKGPLSQALDNLVLKTAYIDNLVAHELTADKLNAAQAYIAALVADGIQAADISADHADVADLHASVARIDDIEAQSAYVKALTAKELTAEELRSVSATVDALDAGQITAEAARIAGAAVKALLVQSGWLDNLTVTGDASVTGQLKGVLVDGDTARFANIYADALKILGEDGLYHALNLSGLDGGAAQAMVDAYGEALDGGLHGSHIIAESITADKIDVTSLMAAMLLTQNIVVGNPLGMRIEVTDSKLSFMSGDAEAAYIEVDERGESVFNFTKGMVVKDLRFADWMWRKRDNGNLSLKWVG